MISPIHPMISPEPPNDVVGTSLFKQQQQGAHDIVAADEQDGSGR
jgi:hypothetical protein